MKRTVLALAALIGCADVGQDVTPDSPAQQRQLLVDGPAEYDLGSLSEEQRDLVLRVMGGLNEMAGFEAFAPNDPNNFARPYGIINAHGTGCIVAEGHAGYSSWSLASYRSNICVEWKDTEFATVAILVHEMLHTLDIGHDDDPDSVMYKSMTPYPVVMPHHIAHIRKLAGLE